MRISLLQMTSSDRPADNLEQVLDAMSQAQGADIFMTPEVTNCVSLSRSVQDAVIQPGWDNPFVARVQDHARYLNMWCLLGSIAVKTGDPDGRFANRSYLINSDGQIVQYYDKLHMFDVTLPNGEIYQESKGYRPGSRAALAQTPWGLLGLTICYDVRFPYLYRTLAQAGAGIIAVPSAFAVPTGQAHWHTLLRARAIETGCYIIAPAQTGTHAGSGRVTYGHSLVVDPWGKVLLDMGQDPGLQTVDIDPATVDKVRQRVPSLSKEQPFSVTFESADFACE